MQVELTPQERIDALTAAQEELTEAIGDDPELSLALELMSETCDYKARLKFWEELGILPQL
jgi:hypothetical protein